MGHLDQKLLGILLWLRTLQRRLPRASMGGGGLLRVSILVVRTSEIFLDFSSIWTRAIELALLILSDISSKCLCSCNHLAVCPLG